MVTRYVTSRVISALAAQGINSGLTLLMNVLVMRGSSVRDFGIYGVIFAALTLIVSLNRAAFGTSLLVFDDKSSQEESLHGPLSASAVVAVLCALILLIAAWVTSGVLSGYLVAFAALAPAWLLEDTFRYYAFRYKLETHVLLLDGVSGLATLGFNAVLYLVMGDKLIVPIIGYAAGLYVAVGLYARLRRLKFSCVLLRLFLRLHRRSIQNLLAENAASAGPRVSLPWILGTLTGLASVAALRGADTIYGLPLAVIAGLTPSAIVYAKKLYGQSSQSVLTFGRYWFAVTATGIIGYAFVCQESLGPLLSTLFGETWINARSLLWPVAILTVAVQRLSAYQIVLRAEGAFAEGAKVRLYGAAPLVLAAVAGALVWGAVGAIVALSVVFLLMSFFAQRLAWSYARKTDLKNGRQWL